jgi:uncharacterized protein YjiS (DUF1127 family)
MTDFTYDTRSRKATHGMAVLAVIRSMLAAAGETLRLWRHNVRTRRQLAMMSPRERHELRYLGDVEAEMQKPFWKK